MTAFVAIEYLYHFQCASDKCGKWWSIGDAPLSTKRTWFCPWCGHKMEVEDIKVKKPT